MSLLDDENGLFYWVFIIKSRHHIDMETASKAPEPSPQENLLKEFMNSPYHCNWLLNHARAMLASNGINAGAEDLVQDTFLKAYRAIRGFNGDCQISTWLYRILLNTFRNFLRAHKRRKEIKMDEEDTLDQFPSKNGESEVAFRELVTFYDESVRVLAPQQKLVFLLCVMRELSYAQTAEHLHLNLAQVRGLLFRARRSIRRALVDFRPEKQ